MVQLDRSLSDMLFTCGAQLQDANIPPNLQEVVFVLELSCDEPIEDCTMLLRLPTYAFIVPHLHVSSWSDTEKYYPQCNGCAKKIPIESEKFKKRRTKVTHVLTSVLMYVCSVYSCKTVSSFR